MPKASCSRSNQAPPMPRTARPPGHVVECRGELGGEPRVAERVRADHQAEAHALRDRPEGRQRRPALEDGLLPGPEDRHQVIPGPDRVPAGFLGGERGVAEPGPVRGLRPELETESGGHRRVAVRFSRRDDRGSASIEIRKLTRPAVRTGRARAARPSPGRPRGIGAPSRRCPPEPSAGPRRS